MYICIYYVDINTPNIVYKKQHILEKREGEREKEWKGGWINSEISEPSEEIKRINSLD